METAGSCVSTMEKPNFWIITSPETATLLFTQNTRKVHIERLAGLASHYSWQDGLIIRHGQRHYGTWAEQPRMSS